LDFGFKSNYRHYRGHAPLTLPEQDEIDRTDKEIDQMVYALYGLTEEEIGIVEES